MQDNAKKAALIFETSWEVCNKIGGIYTVLSTKAKVLQDIYKDKVIFIGPDVWNEQNPSPYFKEYKTLLKGCTKNLKLPFGITIRVGRWTVPGNPIVVLVKFEGVYSELNNIYGKMWEHYKVDSLHAYGDYAEGCAFGVASAIVVDAITNYLKENPANVIAHFNEWTTGMGLLYLQHIQPQIASLFTTHATSIGRSICGNGKPLYDYLSGYNGDQMSHELNMESKHSLEKAAAHNADCFTTVSDVTATECTQLLDITPHVVTPNGFEPNFVPIEKKYNTQRLVARKSLLKIASSLTGKSYDDSTFIIATSGRNEYRNKGIDMFIDSMLHLNTNLGEDCKDVVAFIMVPAWVKEPSQQLLSNLNNKEYTMVDVNFMTHRLNNENVDAITCRLHSINPNKNADKVTIIYLPCYLDGKDGILNILYYDMMPGLDATIFPSYYEPWGYTPLESIAFGVPTISSDKAGFGQWIIENETAEFTKCGVVVTKRTDSNYWQAVSEISKSIENLLKATDDEIRSIRMLATATSKKADWSLFIKYYQEAFAVAIANRNERCDSKGMLPLF